MMSMSAGDFVDIYSRPHYANSFDCVATCFFLDCAHNIIELVEIIHHILKARHLRRPSFLQQHFLTSHSTTLLLYAVMPQHSTFKLCRALRPRRAKLTYAGCMVIMEDKTCCTKTRAAWRGFFRVYLHTLLSARMEGSGSILDPCCITGLMRIPTSLERSFPSSSR